MSLLKKFVNNIYQHKLFKEDDNLMLAVSGGVDSVVLCELCKQANLNFEIAHCNFQLRGEESARDEQFVEELGNKYNVQVIVKKFETEKYASEHKISLQEAARNLRYDWFEKICFEKAFDAAKQGWDFFIDQTKPKMFVLTAHHANDNIETLLMNFFKGTGIKGLQGIPIRKELMPWIVRPLLFAKKEEILNFSKENNLPFVEDSSNITDKYTRNYFRNHLIPSIQKIFPQAEENLLHNIGRFKEIEILYQDSIALHKKKLLEFKKNEVHIPVLKLLKAQPLNTIVYEIVKNYGFTSHQTEEVVRLLKSESGKYVASPTYKIIRNRSWLIIAPVNNLKSNHILINEDDKEVDFELGKLKIKKAQTSDRQPISNIIHHVSNDIATLDADTITFPLLLRKWKKGDYFYPLGMQKKKKLSKFFSDQKISPTEKENTWIIESNKKIIWIVCNRMDERFKVTGNTKKIITISFSEL